MDLTEAENIKKKQQEYTEKIIQKDLIDPDKCYTQYVGKYGKISNGYRTGKGLFSSQSQRRAMPKDGQITAKFH